MCRMKKSSFFATLLAIAILTPTCKTARGFYLGQRNLHIVNWLENGEKLMARCWSKDDSLGTRIVKNKEEFKWKFDEKIFFGHTKFECDLEFNDQGQPRRGRFVVYDSKQMVRRRSCYQNCMWGVGVYGLYAFDEKDKKWDYEIPWPSRNRFESSAQ
ncbi:hypothetical protein OIU84_010541 [Salix udensis]|uniref:S-protein homolog n=1 Tax=Salix udensis TaxID=889485 RepID=A0AAD6JKY8_9ROSI|nr:hypothetical protein OIU84_010541 [Salix udensis]